MNFLTFRAQTIQNRHFVIIPRIRAAQGASDGRNFGERERVTEQVRRDYTKCRRFCMTCAYSFLPPAVPSNQSTETW